MDTTNPAVAGNLYPAVRLLRLGGIESKSVHLPRRGRPAKPPILQFYPPTAMFLVRQPLS